MGVSLSNTPREGSLFIGKKDAVQNGERRDSAITNLSERKRVWQQLVLDLHILDVLPCIHLIDEENEQVLTLVNNKEITAHAESFLGFILD